MDKNKKLLNKMIIVAMFSALCCAGTFINIKMPAGDMVHLGNFVMVVAALLLGGIEGGIVGSLGMGLYDLIFYTSKPSTIIRTFILKFIVGFLVGYLFRLVFKKDKNIKKYLIIFSSIFVLLFIVSIILIVKGDNSGFASVFSFTMYGNTKSIKIYYYVPIFAFIFAVSLVVASVFLNKLSRRGKAALFAITFAVLINIIGEFLLRWLLEGIMVSGFDVSFVTALTKIPGSLITGVVTVILSVLIYEPIYRAIKNNSDFLEDDTIDGDDYE